MRDWKNGPRMNPLPSLLPFGFISPLLAIGTSVASVPLLFQRRSFNLQEITGLGLFGLRYQMRMRSIYLKYLLNAQIMKKFPLKWNLNRSY